MNHRSEKSRDGQRGELFPTGDYAEAYVIELLRTALMLHGVFCDLVEGMPDDAFPGEDPGEVLVEMLIGSIRPAVERAGQRVVQDAIALLKATAERTIDDLRGALAIRRAMDREARGG